MNHLDLGKTSLGWVMVGLLTALVATNLAALILLRTGGPLIGLTFYLVLLAHSLRSGQHDHRTVMVGGLVGLAIHVAEAATMGWSLYPVLMALNLVLPAGLVLAAWVEDRGPRRVAGNE